MFVTKAALINNHPELGIRAQPLTVAPNLESCAIEFSQLTGSTLRTRDLQWLIHGNILFVSAPVTKRLPFHFNSCPHHELTFRGPTLAFITPARKQDSATRLAINGSWAHLVEPMSAIDVAAIQQLFSHDVGNVNLDPATRPLRSIDGRDDSPQSGASGPVGTGEKFGEGDFMTEMFEQLTGAGLDVSLLQDGDGNVLGLAAGLDPEPPFIERELATDPGFYADPVKPAHCMRLTMVPEVSFDPMHFPMIDGFVASLLTLYMRCVWLNVDANLIEPEVGSELLVDCEAFTDFIKSRVNRESPATRSMESPFLAKMPNERGGSGRDSL